MQQRQKQQHVMEAPPLSLLLLPTEVLIEAAGWCNNPVSDSCKGCSRLI
jgi:hypothetical protein